NPSTNVTRSVPGAAHHEVSAPWFAPDYRPLGAVAGWLEYRRLSSATVSSRNSDVGLLPFVSMPKRPLTETAGYVFSTQIPVHRVRRAAFASAAVDVRARRG